MQQKSHHRFDTPQAHERPHSSQFHGVRLDDPYFYFRDKEDKEVQKLIDAENAFTDQQARPWKKLEDQIFQEIKGRMKEDDVGVPRKLDDYFYYTRMEKGKAYPLFARKKGSLENKEEVILDVNRLARGHKFYDIQNVRISPHHRYLAYAYDTQGDESYTIVVKDLETQKLLPDEIPLAQQSLEWNLASDGFFYLEHDASQRPYRMKFHKLNTKISDDPILLEEKDERFFLSFSKTRDRSEVIVTSESKLSSEISLIRLKEPQLKVVKIIPRQKDIRFELEKTGSSYFVLKETRKSNGEILQLPLHQPKLSRAKVFLKESKDHVLESMIGFKDWLVVFERRGGLQNLRAFSLTHKKDVFDLPLDETSCSLGPANNFEFDQPNFRFEYSSFTTPTTTYEINLEARKKKVLKIEEVRGGFQKSDYQSERLFARAQDGTRIPISLVYNRKFYKGKRPENAPLVLQGYGAYGISMDPYLSLGSISLMDRGFIWAYAHIRGGGEFGNRWHDEGRLSKKGNTFSDFIRASEYLISKNWTSRNRIAIWGGSAGGFLIGAVLNARPDLFKAAILQVPFVDVLNTMLDPNLPLTITEYEEWGNPNQKTSFDRIRKYSPYENLRAQAYPAVLALSSYYDTRVPYWEGLKWIQKLRKIRTNPNQPALIRIDRDAGHGGAADRYKSIREIAFAQAFLISQLQINK